jgi:NNP family nitrate/nitrite transporter-like MFS transporter
MESKIAELEKEIDSLHTQFEMMGKNSRGTTDIYGRKFAVPVDAEHKATKFVLATPGGVFGFTMATSNPHNRAFWTSAFGFFSSFFSMFAAAPLMPYMKASLDLTKKQIGSGNIAAVSTNIVMRVIVGFLSDMLGPRRSLAFLLLITTPAILGMMFVQTADAWIACRALIGIALATFVTCQVWCSQVSCLPSPRAALALSPFTLPATDLLWLTASCPQRRRCTPSRSSAWPTRPPPAGATSAAA